MIAHYRASSSIRWNNSGFGSNDPGRNRDKTRAKPAGFDVLFPIDLDREIVLSETGGMTVAKALAVLRSAVPYTIRAETAAGSMKVAHAELITANLELNDARTTARNVLTAIVAALPPGWQATLLAGRVILYKENESYPAGMVIARR